MMTQFHLKKMKCSKISFANLSRINENSENFKSEKIELAKNLCISATNEITEFCSNNFQIKHCLRYCKTCSISEKFEFKSS